MYCNSCEFKYKNHYSNERVIAQMNKLWPKIKCNIIIINNLINSKFVKRFITKRKGYRLVREN
jgi:hypothetical protein